MTDTARGRNDPTDYLPKLLTVWREGYRLSQLKADALAGLTVAIVALPLSMAIAIASGVGPERGLYTAIVGGFLVSALGGSRYQVGGPAGAFIVLVSACVLAVGLPGLILATFLSGFILIGAGALRLGTYIRYIPYPVTVGFTAGIAVIIFASQLRDMFDMSTPSSLRRPASWRRWTPRARSGSCWGTIRPRPRARRLASRTGASFQAPFRTHWVQWAREAISQATRALRS